MSVFQYTRHIFGAKDSPTCANYALRRTAVDNQDRYPDAAYAVLNNFYMDDYLGSVKNPETALRLSRSLVELYKLGGFNLTNFISNVPNLSSKLNPPKNSANNSKEIITAAINPETRIACSWSQMGPRHLYVGCEQRSQTRTQRLCYAAIGP